MATATQTQRPAVGKPTVATANKPAVNWQGAKANQPVPNQRVTNPQVATNNVDDVSEGTGKRGAKPKAIHPMIEALRVDENGEYLDKISELPGDWDRKKFQSIPRNAWTEEYLFLEYKAAQLRQIAESYEQQAQEIRTFGGKVVTKVKGLLKLREKMAALEAKLMAGGITDLDAALKQLQARQA